MRVDTGDQLLKDNISSNDKDMRLVNIEGL